MTIDNNIYYELGINKIFYISCSDNLGFKELFKYFLDITNDLDIKNLTDYYRRNREISILLFSLTYFLNIIDASVNAHLFNYDISDNLSIQIQPTYIIKENINGVTLSLNL